MSHLLNPIIPKKGCKWKAFTITESLHNPFLKSLNTPTCHCYLVWSNCTLFVDISAISLTVHLRATQCLFTWPRKGDLKFPEFFCFVFFHFSNPELTSNFDAVTCGGRPECCSKRSTLQGSRWKQELARGKESLRQHEGAKKWMCKK